MEINEFAKMSRERSLKNDKNKVFDWEYYIIATGGEAGELLNLLKKMKRGDFPFDKDKIADEAADIFTYSLLILAALGVDPEEAIMKKYSEVDRRLEAGGWHKRV